MVTCHRNTADKVIVAAAIGGTASELSGGKFANGAVTAAFATGFDPQTFKNSGSVTAPLNVVGKIWALPNTIIGTVMGMAGVPFGATISFGNNAIQFENYPWGSGVLTLGNSIIYGGGTSPAASVAGLYGDPRILNYGLHERGHTFHYEVLGPLFLPVYFAAGGISASNPFEQAANNYAAGGNWWP